MANTVNLLDFMRAEKPAYTAGGAAYPFSQALADQYQFQPRFGDVTKLYHRDDAGMIHLPRALCPIGKEDRRAQGIKAVFPKCSVPRPHQVEIFGQVAEFIGKGQSGVVLAYTGFGKTHLGYVAAYTAQVRTLVITTKEDIFEQWVTGATEFLGVPAERVGRIRGEVAEVLEADFCVAMIQSLYRDKYPAWVWDQFGLVIFDEVQRLPAEEFAKTVWKLPGKIRLGITAKAHRADGKDILIDAHIGPTRAKAEGEGKPPKVLVYKSGWKCPRRWVTLDEGHEPVLKVIPHEPGRTAHVDGILCTDPERNKLIANAILEVHATPRRLVVFSTRNEHLKDIHAACIIAGVPADAMAFYLGASTKAEKAENLRAKTVQVVLTNYSKMGEGTNWPWLDTALFAMPRSDVEQPAGRVRREDPEYPNKRHPTLIDIVDDDSPIYGLYARNRRKWYSRVGAEIIAMN